MLGLLSCCETALKGSKLSLHPSPCISSSRVFVFNTYNVQFSCSTRSGSYISQSARRCSTQEICSWNWQRLGRNPISSYFPRGIQSRTHAKLKGRPEEHERNAASAGRFEHKSRLPFESRPATTVFVAEKPHTQPVLNENDLPWRAWVQVKAVKACKDILRAFCDTRILIFGLTIILACIDYLHLIDFYIRVRNQTIGIGPASKISRWWLSRPDHFLGVFPFTPADWLKSPMSLVTTAACIFFYIEPYHLLANLMSNIPFLAMLKMSMKSMDIVICFV